ncbi:recQ-mediated genome instability protein 1-like [Strongylocentrotus purpuratus]|uniref:RecQ-mediated genome instability protein 1 n=1 Tax=Strongylocentrotus purpuratus TaxID=7668 RepID=A0A7M7PHY8_STRPU|nr:recQ-mediated genome instability protein 1-like [Strongylocentrotus purpuratus]
MKMGVKSDGVKAWLRSRHISVLGEWVEACMEWIQEEHQGTVLSGSQLCKMVYEQWLDSELTEIATPCLPAGIKQAKKTQLKGNYALQVNCIQDISSPAYAQLTKLQGRENENDSVTAVPATQGKFEPPSSRMLMLSLTDGQETIQAMEYRPVPGFTANLNPGAKIMLSGDMQCRLGVILLTPAHVKVLGGEVEALKEANSQEKMLARAIGVTPPDRPVGSNNRGQGTTATVTTTTGQTTTTTNNTTTAPVQNQPVTTIQRQQSNQHKTLPRDTSHKAPVKQEPRVNTPTEQRWNQGHIRQISDTKQGVHHGFNQGHSRSNQDTKPTGHHGWNQGPSRSVQDTKPVGHQGFQDPFLVDDDDGLDELMLEELENLEKQEAQKVKPEPELSHQDWDVEDIDEEDLLAMEWESSNKQMQNGQRQNNPREQPYQRHSTAVRSSSNLQENRGGSSIKPFSSVSHSLPGSERTKIPPVKTQLPKASNTSPTFASNVVPLFKREMKPPSASRISQGPQRTELCVVQPINSTRTQHVKHGDQHSFGRADRGVQLPVNTKIAVATRIMKAESVSQQGHGDVVQGAVGKTDVGSISEGSERRDFVSAQSLVKSEEGENAPKRMRIHSGPKCTRPFIYLTKMADQLKRKEACRFDIKGFIMTLVSSLSHNPSWSLAAKINDGTMSLDVDISDKVLSKMIGFTVAEMMEMKASMKKSEKEKANEIKESIKQGIGRCQQALIDLSCIMTIEVNPEYPRPLVIAVRQPTMDDCNALRRCLEESQWFACMKR